MSGDGYPFKVPTTNVAVRLPEGMYRGAAWLENKKLGNCAVWVVPHRPMIAEVYITRFRGDLYGEELELRNLRRVGREEMIELYDKALT